MVRKITLRTKLKKGDIVRTGNTLLGIVAKLEQSRFYAFNNFPGDRQFAKENDGVDWYRRCHITELVKREAEIISPIELVVMFENAECTIRTLQCEYIPHQNDTLENCEKNAPSFLKK